LRGCASIDWVFVVSNFEPHPFLGKSQNPAACARAAGPSACAQIITMPKQRFPAARIKRAIQADPDIGQVAKDTTVAVSAALELFLQDLLQAAAQAAGAASAGGSGDGNGDDPGSIAAAAAVSATGTIRPHHIKRAIFAHPRFDVLKDLVKDVAEPQQGEQDKKVNAMPRRAKTKRAGGGSRSPASKRTKGGGTLPFAGGVAVRSSQNKPGAAAAGVDATAAVAGEPPLPPRQQQHHPQPAVGLPRAASPGHAVPLHKPKSLALERAIKAIDRAVDDDEFADEDEFDD
jgi:hypothetical protein